MECSMKLTDFFPPAKRVKLSASSSQEPDNSDILSCASKSAADFPSPSPICTAQPKSQTEFTKWRSQSILNRENCLGAVSKLQEETGYVKLEMLLVEKTWLEALPGELQKPYAKSLCEFIANEMRNDSAQIYPPIHLIFDALNSTPFERVKVVIIGQDPYHGPGQAMGLSFSVPENVKKLPPSLVNIFKELQQDLGCSTPSHGNLEQWAVQGVLLLNTVLTGEDICYAYGFTSLNQLFLPF